MSSLNKYGWNSKLDQLKQQSTFREYTHGRIIVTHKTRYEVISEEGVISCEIIGNLRFTKSDHELPCTGDWVLFLKMDENQGYIYDILPRQKTLYRLKVGSQNQKQALAAYVDKAFIVQALDQSFNVRRIERLVNQIQTQNIIPTLILTKQDIPHEPSKIHENLQHLENKIAIYYSSIFEPQSIEAIKKNISEEETVVFIGLSGAGKSSLINHLYAKKLLATANMSHSTGKGCHTSTRRELILIPQSGVVIDTPGIKQFGISNDNTSNLAELLDIDSLAQDCLFKDCQHINEKGCAVLEALENETLDYRVYKNYIKLRKEAMHYSRSKYEKKKKDKALSKHIKQVLNKN